MSRFGQLLRSGWSAFGLGALIFGLYSATLTDVHTFDALSYVLDVDRKPLAELLHPHHLAYGPFGALIGTGARALGAASSAMVPLQLANALAGALGAVLFAQIVLRNVANDLLLAAALTLSLVASYAYWYYAVEIEVYTIAALFLITSLGLIAQLLTKPTPATALLLGICHGWAVLFHQTNALLGLPIGLALWWASGQRWARFCQLSGAYGLPAATIVVGSYALAGVGIAGQRTPTAFAEWFFGYATTGWWGGAPSNSRLALLGQGLSETLLEQGGSWLGAALIGIALVLWWRGGRSRPDRLSWVLWLWLAIYGGFFFWWEPDNIEFWIASLPPALLLIGKGITYAPSRRERQLGAALCLGLGALALGLNASAITTRGDATRDLQRTISASLAAQSRPDDLIIVPDGLQELYLPYYEGRNNVRSLNAELFASGGEFAAACAAMQALITTASEAGLAVIIGEAALRPQPANPGEPDTPLERFNLTSDQVEGCYSPYRAMLQPLELPASLPAYRLIPPAQALATGEGWDFQRGNWGWRVANSEAQTMPNGWRLIPTSDPYLLSPPFNLQLSDYQALEITIATTTADRQGQVFFLDGQGQADEARSLRWEMSATTVPTTYRLELANLPERGQIGGLRIDPIGAGDGGEVRLIAVRFVP